jgi:hypothetical protein
VHPASARFEPKVKSFSSPCFGKGTGPSEHVEIGTPCVGKGRDRVHQHSGLGTKEKVDSPASAREVHVLTAGAAVEPVKIRKDTTENMETCRNPTAVLMFEHDTFLTTSPRIWGGDLDLDL